MISIDMTESGIISVHYFMYVLFYVAIAMNCSFCKRIVAARKGNESVDLSSLQTLGAETWLNDHVINFIAKQLIQRETPDTHCYSSYFFTQLLRNASDENSCDFSQVCNWHRS